MRHLRTAAAPILLVLALLLPSGSSIGEEKKDEKKKDPNALVAPELFQTLEPRSIGPFRGGRVTAVAGVPGVKDTFYMGSTGGGVWKSVDGGGSWSPIADEYLKSGSIGALAVAPSDPNVIYAGTGSGCPRGNVSPGDGVYRSTDGGATWQNVGLRDAGQISRIHVHPQDPDIVYVAVLGNVFGPSATRGIYVSKDGGKNWTRSLFVSEQAGASDLALDPNNPRILYAGFWEVLRKPWTLKSGGDGSGLHRSRDGGETWEKLSDGLPGGVLGRIGVSASGGKAGRVWALVEAEDGGLFRSDDYGKTFRKVNGDRNFRQRAWYYTHVYADPKDADVVYILNVGMWRSRDGGKSFDFVRTPHGDNHDLWIQPADNSVMVEGNDGGANVSYNGGRSWSTQANQPTAEFYRVAVDDGHPYRVYGCQQDNTCVSIASRTDGGAIGAKDWYVIGGGESGHVAPDPRDPNVTYAGSYGGYITRQDHATGQERNITSAPQVAVGLAPKDLKYRFQWNAPIRVSPHDPDVIYHCSNFVHRSNDAGQSWQVISPDLTRDDKTKQEASGEPITHDNTGVEVYGTIFAFEESPLTRGLLWAGSDDGRVHVSRDGGKQWKEVTPARMPDWGQVNSIEPSRRDPARAYLAVTRYKLDDKAPYIFRTDDYGGSWKLLTDGNNGIPKDHFVRVVREDPDKEDVLYAGTEYGLYVSFDAGRHWQSLQQKMPVSPVTDLQVKNKDLVIATQGRSFWILDDLTPLHQMEGEMAGADTHLFKPRDYTLFSGGAGGSGGTNPPGGVILQYLLKDEIKYEGKEADAKKAKEKDEVVLEILDQSGTVLRKLSSVTDEPQAPDPDAKYFPDQQQPRKLTTKKGMNRYVWDLHLADATLVDDAVTWGSAQGPRVPPGTYKAKLTYHGKQQTQDVRVLANPQLRTSQQDLDARFALSKRIWDSMNDTHKMVKRIRDVKAQSTDLGKRLEAAGKGTDVKDAAKALSDELTPIEEKLHQFKIKSSQDVLNYVHGIDQQFVGLLGVVESADARPTDPSVARYDELRAELDSLLALAQEKVDANLPKFNDLVRSKGVGPVFY